MEKNWILTIAIATFLLLNFLFNRGLYDYIKKEVGKKMWKIGRNKVYFWLSSIFFSSAGTALIMYTLKWMSVLNF